MKPKIQLPVSTQNLWVSGICLGAALLCFILLIYPGMQRIPEMEQKIAGLEQQIKTQEILQPAYQQLEKAQERVGENRGRLSRLFREKQKPDKGADTQGEIKMEALQALWKQTAAGAGVNLKTVAPDIKSLIEDSDKVGVHIRVSGKLSPIRDFLLRLIAETPNFDRLQNINLQMIEASETLDMEITLQLLQSGS